MSLKKVKVLHGLVIRISGDTGEQIGAHVEYVERIVDTKTGAVEAAKMLPPEPLEPGADALAPLIGEVVRAQQAALDRVERALATAEQDLGAERQAHAATTQQVEQLQRRIQEVEKLLTAAEAAAD